MRLTIDRTGITFRVDGGHFTSSLDIMLPSYMHTALNEVRSCLNRIAPRWRSLDIEGESATVTMSDGEMFKTPYIAIPKIKDLEFWMEREREWLLSPSEEERPWRTALSEGDLEETRRSIRGSSGSFDQALSEAERRLRECQQGERTYSPSDSEIGPLQRLSAALKAIW